VFRKALVGFELICSELVLNELQRTLLEKFRLPRHVVVARIAYLRDAAELADAADAGGLNVQQESDAAILAAARAAGVRVFVTGDRELLDLQQLGDMAIASPRTFWEEY
jgi:predicted nucleic acid-binding protein